MEQHEVIVVGGGPAGAATAIGLARRGRDVLLLERSAVWHWRACGVFTSPATVSALRRLGLTPTELDAIARPVPAMRVETPAGVRFRMTYGDTGSAGSTAVGLDRARLDPLLLDKATAAGVDVRRGVSVRGMHRDVVKVVDGEALRAAVIVGADGLRSIVARDAGVVRPPSLGNRLALTFHVAEASSETRASADGAPAGMTRDARMIAFRGGYVGLA